MLNAAAAAVGWALIGWMPGLLLGCALRPRAGIGRNAALAPLVSLGLLMAVGQTLELAHARIEAITCVPLLLGVAAVAGIARMRLHASAVNLRAARGRLQEHVRGVLARTDTRLLLLSAGAGLVIWRLAIPSLQRVLPDADGTNHGTFASRILHLGTIDPQIVTAGDLAGGPRGGHYYPLTLHLATALISELTGADVNTVLTVGFVLAASVVLPVGTYLLTRRLIPSLGQSAAIAGLISVCFPWFPYSAIWGAVPLIVGMGFVPVAVDSLLDLHAPRRARAGVLVGMALFGIFTTHNSELVTVVLFAAILAVWEVRIGRGRIRAIGTLWGAAAIVALFLVAPILGQIVHGASESTTFLGNGASQVSAPVRTAIFVANPVVLLLAIAGLSMAVRAPAARGWVVCLIAVSLLQLGTVARIPGLTLLTTPWYSNWVRVSYLFSYFEASFAAVAVAWLIQGLRRIGRPRRNLAMRKVGLGIGCLIALTVPLAAIVTAGGQYQVSSLDGTDQRAAFAWLAGHTRPGERVLNQFIDGSGWMETLAGVAPVFPVNPWTPPLDPQSVWGDRWYLLTHAAQIGTDPRAARAARTWNVRYVYVNNETFGHLKPRLSVSALAKNDAYRAVWTSGPATIFEIVRSASPVAEG